MRLIDRYNLRQLAVAFLTSLAVLTVLIWLTQALREFDLITKQGQALLEFLAVTILALPSLIVIILPVSLFIAIVWTLNRLNNDSELVVMTGGGISTARFSVPFVMLTLLVSAAVAAITLHLQPTTTRMLRTWAVQAGVGLFSRIADGRFVSFGDATINIRERQPNGVMLGLFIQAPIDNQIYTYVAERGQLLTAGTTTVLAMEKGFVQQQQDKESDPVIVSFERYAFDLSQLTSEPDVTILKPRERSVGELLYPSPDDKQYIASPGKFRAELVDRFTAPLYPVVFMFVALAALGQARTTRQSRSLSMAVAIVAIVVVRVAGFATQTLSARSDWGAVLAFAIPIGVSLFCITIIFGWIKPRLPQWLGQWGATLQQRVSSRGSL